MTKNEKTLLDGGYYAIKGFEYQIDKAILELLNCKNENQEIGIERIQDIDSDDFVIQVKYKEAKKFIPSQIKSPTIQLANEFRKNSKKKYILYAYFNDLNGYESFVDCNKKITLVNLNKILGDKKQDFSEKLKKEFIKNFILDFSNTFQVQFESVLKKLKEFEFIGKTNEEAAFYYANITDYLRKIVTYNSPKKAKARFFTQKAVFDFLKNGKNLVFNSSFRAYQGDQEYFKFIKLKYFTKRNIDDYERFIILELLGDESIDKIKEIIITIKNRFYNKSGGEKQVIKSGAPYIYFQKISGKDLTQLKTILQRENILFVDGHSFLDAAFSLQSIKKYSTIHNNVCLKFINKSEDLFDIINFDCGKTKEIYQFYITKAMPLMTDYKIVEVQIKDISDINYII